MLLKLIKHEFKSTSKQTLPIYIGMISLSLFCRFVAFPLLDKENNFFIESLCIIVVMAFSICMMVISVMPLVLSATRFKKNILQDEGYLTLTLPISSHQLIISKLVVNTIWYTLTGILGFIVLMILAADFYELFSIDLLSLFKNMNITTLSHFIICGIELLIIYVTLISLGTLIIYASYAVGFSFNKNKSLLTVVMIFVFANITSWMMIAGTYILGVSGISFDSFGGPMGSFFEVILFLIIIFLLLISTIYYFITNHFITKRLNLE